MLVCWTRPRPHRLAAFSFFNLPARSTFTTSDQTVASTSQPVDKSQDSIFTAPESPWDHVFSDIDSNPPSLRAPRLRARAADDAGPGRKKDYGPNQLVQRASGVRHQRASITAREMSVFDEMFDLIFSAVSGKEGRGSTFPSGLGSSTARPLPSAVTPSVAGQTPSIGHPGAPLNDLFRKLRRHTSRVRWTTAIDEELDRKKETMELFNTDHELLQWVTMELFGESRQWDEEAKKAIAASSTGKTNVEGEGNRDAIFAEVGSSADTSASASASTPASSSLSSGTRRERPINHSIYPHLIAHAMRIFRTTYSNPSLSLAVFNHAARASIPSYVFGCTAPAYNELIEAKWEGWGNLEGVCNALEEMRANGVKIDGRTRLVVEKVRREVGTARPVELGEAKQDGEEGRDEKTGASVNPLAINVWKELGEAEVMRLLHRIEQLALRDRSRKMTTSPYEESWKSAVLQPGENDGWSFDGWEKTGDARKRRRKMSQDEDGSGEKAAFR